MKRVMGAAVVCFLVFLGNTVTMGGGFIHESRTFDGELVKDTYVLVHDFLEGQTTTITDVNLTGDDLSYVAGWISVESPTGWYLQIGGPGTRGTRWVTDYQEYGVGYLTSLSGFSITTYGFQLVSQPIEFSTGPEHSVNDWGAYHFAQLPTPEPATLSLLVLGGLALLRRRAS